MVKSPTESCQICGSQSLFSASLYEEQLGGELLLEVLDRGGRTIRRPVVNYQDVILSVQREYLTDNPFDVLDLVESGDYDNFVVSHSVLRFYLNLFRMVCLSCSPDLRVHCRYNDVSHKYIHS